MKKLIYILPVLFALFSCGEKTFKDGNTIVNFHIKGLTAGQAVIEKLPVGPVRIPVDTVSIGSDGVALFKFSTIDPAFYSVYVLGQEGEVRFVAEDGDSINITAVSGSINASSKVDGTLENKRLDSLSAFMSASRFYTDSLRSVYQKAQQQEMHYAIHDEFVSLFSRAERKETKYALSYIQNNPNQISNLIALNTLDRNYFRDVYLQVEKDLLKKFPNSEYVKTFQSKNFKFYPPDLGKQAPIFTLPNELDQQISLASFQGKFVLIDFWATWCGPCIKEIPNLKRAAQYFKEDNFEVISVCIDKNSDVQKSTWKRIIESHNATWTQLYDAEGETTVSAYKISAFPTLLLINPEGVIIEKGDALRGPNNLKILAKHLRNEK